MVRPHTANLICYLIIVVLLSFIDTTAFVTNTKMSSFTLDRIEKSSILTTWRHLTVPHKENLLIWIKYKKKIY